MPSLTLRRETVIVVVATLLAAVLGWAVFEFQPIRQLRKTFSAFVQTGEKRNWEKGQTFLAADYKDQWGLDREQAVLTAKELFAQFLVLGITTDPVAVSVNGNEGTVRTKPRLQGSGTPIAQMIIARANDLPGEMTFQWRKESWKPWDWKLTSASHPDIGPIPEL